MTTTLQYARLRYREQRKGARNRNILFQFTFKQWYDWWLSHGVDRNIPRINDSNVLCMCRYNDTGPYELSNVYCATKKQNTVDAHANGKVPYNHKKPIMTPAGLFESRHAAATYYKLDVTSITRRMNKHPSQYYYL